MTIGELRRLGVVGLTMIVMAGLFVTAVDSRPASADNTADLHLARGCSEFVAHGGIRRSIIEHLQRHHVRGELDDQRRLRGFELADRCL